MEERERQLIKEIRALFDKLTNEPEGEIVGVGKYFPPSKVSYVSTAEKLYGKAIELQSINPQYDTSYLNDIMGREIKYVEHFKPIYKNGKITSKSEKELTAFMRKATKEIKLACFEILSNIETN